MSRRFYTDTSIESAPAPAQPQMRGMTLFDLVEACMIASMALVVVAVGASWLIWRDVWLELVIALFLLPFALLAVGMLLLEWRHLVWTLESMIHRDLDYDGEVGQPERVRLVPVNKRIMVNGVDSEDLELFARAAVEMGDWTQATWRGRQMPSGKRCDNGYHSLLMDCLTKVGIVRDYGRGTAGHLGVTETEEALRLLGV